MTFDVGQVFARGPVLHFEIPCRDVAYLVAVGDNVDFNGVILIGEIGGVAYVNWYTTETLVQYLVMNPRRIYGDT